MSSSERGSWPIAMNRPVAARSRVSPVTVSRRVSDSRRSVPLIEATSAFQTNLELGVGERPLLHDLGGPQLAASVDQGHLRPEPGQEGGLLDRGVAAADHGDVLLAEEETVTRRTPGHATTGELRLVGQAELAVARTRRQDHRPRRVGVGGGLDDLHLAGEVDLDDVVGDQLGAEPLGLGAHVVHQGRAHDAVAEAGEVLDLGGVHQRAASGHRTLEHQRVQRGPRGVDRGRVARRSGADDDHVARRLG